MFNFIRCQAQWLIFNFHTLHCSRPGFYPCCFFLHLSLTLGDNRNNCMTLNANDFRSLALEKKRENHFRMFCKEKSQKCRAIIWKYVGGWEFDSWFQIQHAALKFTPHSPRHAVEMWKLEMCSRVWRTSAAGCWLNWNLNSHTKTFPGFLFLERAEVAKISFKYHRESFNISFHIHACMHFHTQWKLKMEFQEMEMNFTHCFPPSNNISHNNGWKKEFLSVGWSDKAWIFNSQNLANNKQKLKKTILKCFWILKMFWRQKPFFEIFSKK